MNDVDEDYQTSLGVTPTDIATLTRQGWHKHLKRECPDDPNEIQRWAEAMERIFDLCERQVAGVGYDEIARVFQAQASGEEPPDNQPALVAFAWEAAVRQAVCLIMAMDRAEFDEARDHDWTDWITRRSRGEVIIHDSDGDEGEDGDD